MTLSVATLPDLGAVLAELLERQQQVEVALRGCDTPGERSALMERHRLLIATSGQVNGLRNLCPTLERRARIAAERRDALRLSLDTMDAQMKDQPELAHRCNEGPRMELVGMVNGATAFATEAATALIDCQATLDAAVKDALTVIR